MGTTKEKVNKWFIAYKRRGADLFDLSGLKVIEPPEGKYYADPFIIKHDGRDYLFFEEYDYDKGRLVYSVLTDKGISEPVEVMHSDTHQSFPAIFKDGQDYFMTPEQVLSGELVIYRAVKFPDVWERYAVVARGRFDDPVLTWQDGEFRIYTTEGGNDLRVFHAKEIAGPWEVRLRQNELHARSAGNIFNYGGKMIRPTQDCIGGYGNAIVFKNLVTGQELRRIEPTWHPKLTGTHTFNANEDYCVIDGRIKL